jgi:peptidoglycan/xylan/chitin deacetylase (PgdA/CDA1 family)
MINKNNIGMIVSLHSIREKTTSHWGGLNQFIELTPANFEQIIKDLKNLNVRFLSLEELETALAEKGKFSKPLVHFSFDDGYRDNFQYAFPVLKKYGIPFSIFVVSDFINNSQPFLWWYMVDHIISQNKPIIFDKYNFGITANMYNKNSKEELFELLRNFLLDHVDENREYFEAILRSQCNDYKNLPETLCWDELNEMVASGLCELGVHTKTHARSVKLSEEQMEQEVVNCMDAIFKHTGVISKWFAYPYGGISDIGERDTITRMMKRSGIKLGLTTISNELRVDSNRYFLPRIFLNNSSNLYTLKTRLNGSYQRSRVQDQSAT